LGALVSLLTHSTQVPFGLETLVTAVDGDLLVQVKKTRPNSVFSLTSFTIASTLSTVLTRLAVSNTRILVRDKLSNCFHEVVHTLSILCHKSLQITIVNIIGTSKMVDKTGRAELPQLGRGTSVFVDGLNQWRLWDLSNTDETILNLVHDLIAKIKVKGSLVGECIELFECQC
jgi:hypothetical protein